MSPRGRAAAMILLAALAAAAELYIVHHGGRVRKAKAGAIALAHDLARATEEAEVELLACGPSVRLRLEADRAEARLDSGEFSPAPVEETQLAIQVGAALRVVGLLPRSIARLERAGSGADEELARAYLARGDELLALVRAASALDARDPDARRVLLVGTILEALGDVPGARAFFRESTRLASDVFVRSQALAELAGTVDGANAMDEAVGLRREALDAVTPWAPRSDPRVADRMYELASTLDDAGPVTAEEARRLYQSALDARLASSCGDSIALATHRNNLGLLLKRMRRYREAESHLVPAYEMRRRLVPGDDPGAATMMNNLGTLMHALGELRRAKEMISLALVVRRRICPEGDRDVAESLQSLAWLMQERGEPAEAVEHARAAVAILRKLATEDDLDLAVALDNLGTALTDAGKPAEAETVTREALAMEERMVAGNDPRRAQTLENLGVILYRRNRELPEAEGHLTQALEMRRALYGDGHHEVAESLMHLAWLHERAKDYPRAERRYREAILLRRTSCPDPEILVALQSDLADCLFASGDPARATDEFLEATATALANLPSLSALLVQVVEGLVASANKSHRHLAAEPALLAAAETVYADQDLLSFERARVVEALCVLYSLWPEDAPEVDRVREQRLAWTARLDELQRH